MPAIESSNTIPVNESSKTHPVQPSGSVSEKKLAAPSVTQMSGEQKVDTLQQPDLDESTNHTYDSNTLNTSNDFKNFTYEDAEEYTAKIKDRTTDEVESFFHGIDNSQTIGKYHQSDIIDDAMRRGGPEVRETAFSMIEKGKITKPPGTVPKAIIEAYAYRGDKVQQQKAFDRMQELYADNTKVLHRTYRFFASLKNPDLCQKICKEINPEPGQEQKLSERDLESTRRALGNAGYRPEAYGFQLAPGLPRPRGSAPFFG